ncbi:hypothetical protein B0H14DRAFT_2587943 [Mycena olivaceomarginata]|nr:hypothetical protein B0H14DRAFT_2587943 [Mycena olivaceomarginata]
MKLPRSRTEFGDSLNHAKRTHGLTSHQEPCLRWQASRELGDRGTKELNQRHWYNPATDKTGTRTSGPERPNKQLVRAAKTPEPDPNSGEVVRFAEPSLCGHY